MFVEAFFFENKFYICKNKVKLPAIYFFAQFGLTNTSTRNSAPKIWQSNLQAAQRKNKQQ